MSPSQRGLGNRGLRLASRKQWEQVGRSARLRIAREEVALAQGGKAGPGGEGGRASAMGGGYGTYGDPRSHSL